MPVATQPQYDPEADAAEILLVGFSLPLAHELKTECLADSSVLQAETPEDALGFLAERRVAALCLGSGIAGDEAREFLVAVARDCPAFHGSSIVLAAGNEPQIFQDLVDQDRIYYLAQSPLSGEDIAGIVRGAVRRFQAREKRHHPGAATAENEGLRVHRILKMTAELSREPSLVRVAAGAAAAINELTAADRTATYLYQPEDDTLRCVTTDRRERIESAASGLASFVVRSGATVCLDEVGPDPRYDAEADNPEGGDADRLLAVPVAETDGDRIWAVLVAVRDPSRPAFDERQRQDLELLAEHLAPILGRFMLTAEIERTTVERHGAKGSQAAQIFRQEALDEHLEGFENRGRLLRISPSWTRPAYWVVVSAFAAALVYSLIGSIHEYASGAAVVRVTGRTEVNSTVSGSVVAVEVEAGQRVQAGELLVRLYGAQQEAELERLRNEFDLGLVNRLRRPNDAGAERALATLLSQKQMAERRLEERSVRAPHDGTVLDVWARPGQHLVPGEAILSLEGQEPELGVVALLPGQFRPLIEPGMPLRLELRGYSYLYQDLTVESVGDEVIGPQEARRALGPDIGDAVPIDGPVVFVYARLPAKTFTSGDHDYPYHDGIPGRAEVRVRSEPILLTLVPGLKALWPDSYG